MNDKAVTNTTLNWIFKTIQIVAAIALPIIGWVGLNTLERVSMIEKEIVQLRLDSVQTANTKVQVTDWLLAKQALDNKDYEMDKRITKLEDNFFYIRSSMDEMKIIQKENFMEINKNQKEIIDKFHALEKK